MNWLDGMAIRVWGRRVSPLLVGWVSSKVQKGMAIVTQKLLILLLKDPNKNTKFENVLKSLRFVKVRGKNFQLLYFHLSWSAKAADGEEDGTTFFFWVATTWGSAMRCLWALWVMWDIAEGRRFEGAVTEQRSIDSFCSIILEWRWNLKHTKTKTLHWISELVDFPRFFHMFLNCSLLVSPLEGARMIPRSRAMLPSPNW